jgi:hypothetical protein
MAYAFSALWYVPIYISLFFIQTFLSISLIDERNKEMNDEKKLDMQQPCRSQTPQGPFNYIQEEVHFSNGNEKITLSGILTLPRGAGAFSNSSFDCRYGTPRS